MLEKKSKDLNQMELISIEELVPKDHLLRKIDSAVNFTHIYDFVEDLYCKDNGRPGIDPDILFKMVLIQHLYGIPLRSKCTNNAKYEKTVVKHIWQDYLEKVEDMRHTSGMKALYDRRKETIERVFADAKEKHSMRFTYFRGLSQVGKWVRLKFAAMNLKKYAIHRWNRGVCYLFSLIFDDSFLILA